MKHLINRKVFLNWIKMGFIASVIPILRLNFFSNNLKNSTVVAEENNDITYDNSIIFYVSPLGKDTWSGMYAIPNKNKSDGPFATIKRAQDAIRQLKSLNNDIKQTIKILIREGIYYLNLPLIFHPDDSGTAKHPIIFAAYENEKPIISFGRVIEGWQQEIIDGKVVWSAEIVKVRNGQWYFKQLWVNSQRRNRARYPKQGYLKIAEVIDAKSHTSSRDGDIRFRFFKSDLEQFNFSENDHNDTELIVTHNWAESRVPVTQIDKNNNIIYFGKRTTFNLAAGNTFYLENSLDFLTKPGEWYLNSKSGKLYYFPLENEDINNAVIIAAIQPLVVRFEGKPEVNQFVENIHFKNLTFSHTEWSLPDNISGFAQAAVGVPGAIYGKGVRYCQFNQCNFSHLGTYGISFIYGCHYNLISNCNFFDLGGGGIRIGEGINRVRKEEQTIGNKVNGCHIYDGGLLFHSAVGIWLGIGNNNQIVNNHIHNFYYTGISINWKWGYEPTNTRSNTVASNYIHHIGKLSNGDGPILSDMGGIYTLGVQPNTIISSNVIHDIAALKYGGWGIYLDEGSSEILVEKNLVYKTTHGGFHQHYGRENMIKNNIFAFGGQEQIYRTRAESHISFHFQGNIVYWSSSLLLNGKWDDYNFYFDRNIYWKIDDQENIKFAGLSNEEWSRNGMDINSIIDDPLFMAPEQDDFRLKHNSPALKLEPALNYWLNPRFLPTTAEYL